MSIRITSDQAKLIFGKPLQRPPSAKAPQRKTKAEIAAQPENQVVAQIKGYLEAKGWRVTRQQSGLFQRPDWGKAEADGGDRDRYKGRIRIGTKGALDWVCTRAVGRINPHEQVGQRWYFELEMKGAGKKPSDAQCEYMRRLHAEGITAVWFDNFSEFRDWYRRRFRDES